jgi:hypothetical protein
VTVASQKNGPLIPLEDRRYHTDTTWQMNSTFFCYAWISVAQYKQLCQLTVPLILKVALSDQTVKSGKDFLSHTCAETAYKIPFDLDHPHSLHEVLVCMFSTSYTTKFDDSWF